MYSMYLLKLAVLTGIANLASATYSCTNLTLLKGAVETDVFYVYSAEEVPYNVSTGVPAYCDINAKISNRINIWAKFPLNSNATYNSIWNARFTQYGCGGGCGTNPFLTDEFASSLVAGYAISTNDMGMWNSFFPYCIYLLCQ
jgi:hypothetical protein